MAFFFAMLLFSLAGIPPLAGFFAKFYVFLAAIKAGLYVLAGHRRAGQRGRRLLLPAHRQGHVFRRAGRELRADGGELATVLAVWPVQSSCSSCYSGAADRATPQLPRQSRCFQDGSSARPRARQQATGSRAFDAAGLDQRRGHRPRARRRARAACGSSTGDQTAGRGRRGRAWVSRQGNLAASLLLSASTPPALPPRSASPPRSRSRRRARGMRGARRKIALTAVAAGRRSRPRLKWPNDVLLDGAKLAGILASKRRAPPATPRRGRSASASTSRGAGRTALSGDRAYWRSAPRSPPAEPASRRWPMPGRCSRGSGTAAAALRRSATTLAGARRRHRRAGRGPARRAMTLRRHLRDASTMPAGLVVRRFDGTRRRSAAGEVHFGLAASRDGRMTKFDRARAGFAAARRRRRDRHECRPLRPGDRAPRANG